MSCNLKREDYNSDEEFIMRVYESKSDNQMTNSECKEYINFILQTNYSESTLRGIAKYSLLGFEIGYDKGLSEGKTLEPNEKNNKEVQPINMQYKETIELNKDGSQTSDKLLLMSKEDCKNVEFLLKAHGYDTKVFELVSAKNNIWNAYSKQDGIMTLYSSKITVKPRHNDISMEELEEWFNKLDKKYQPSKLYTNTIPTDGMLLEVPLVDVHYNKRSYEIEVGQEGTIAKTEEDFLKVISNIIERTKGKKIEKIVFPIGNDFYNTDTSENTTTRGTRQDVELRWQEMFLKGSELLIKGIDLLAEVAPVEVFYVAGNHDKMAGFYVTLVLSSWYRNDERVLVSKSSKTRKYIKFGKCLIGYTHGDKEKNKIFGIMQQEQPRAWGETLYREWHLGHLHHEVTKENQGVIVRHLSSISPTDAWHYECGYVGSLQKAQAFLWDKNKGLMDILLSYV